MSSSIRRWAVLAGVLVLAPGCLKMSPKKACERGEELSGKEMPNCVEQMTTMKEKRPEEYACTTKCLRESKTNEALRACAGTCSTGGGVASGSAKQTPVDEVTPARIRARAVRMLGLADAQLTDEVQTASTYSARLSLGKSRPRGLARVYEITLLDIGSHAEGERILEKLPREGLTDRLGDKKALALRCVLMRDPAEGNLHACGGADSKLETVMDTLTRP